MKDTDWAYLAGIIDADGSVGIYLRLTRNNYGMCQLSVCGDSYLVEWLDSAIPGAHILLNRRTWHWITGKRSIIVNVLIHTIPYMTTKRREAELMVECLERSKPDYAYYSEKLKFLKRLRHKASGGEQSA